MRLRGLTNKSEQDGDRRWSRSTRSRSSLGKSSRAASVSGRTIFLSVRHAIEDRLESRKYGCTQAPWARHSNLKRTVHNQFALVYEWRGADRSLKPILLTAHQGQLWISMSTHASSIYVHIYAQDTIPVDIENEEEWIHQPFSGYFDGKPPLCFGLTA